MAETKTEMLSVEGLGALLRGLGIEPSSRRLAGCAGQLFVVKCGGTLIENPETGEGVLDDVAALARGGVRVVLVHGGSVQADCEMEAAGIVPRRHRGLRITCARTIEILGNCFGRLNCEIVAALERRGVAARGFHGDARLMRACRLQLDDVDLGFVGEVTSVDRACLDSLPAGTVAVVSAISAGEEGGLLNVNADYVASRVALGAGAAKLLLLSDVPGVLRDRSDPGSVIPQLTLREAAKLIADGTIDRGMIPKIESAMRAVEDGLPEVYLLDGKRPHALLCAVFTEDGCGTHIVREGNAL